MKTESEWLHGEIGCGIVKKDGCVKCNVFSGGVCRGTLNIGFSKYGICL